MGIPAGHCGFCNNPLNNKPINCPNCQAPYHADCWKSNDKKCSIYGCSGAEGGASAVTLTRMVNITQRDRDMASKIVAGFALMVTYLLSLLVTYWTFNIPDNLISLMSLLKLVSEVITITGTSFLCLVIAASILKTLSACAFRLYDFLVNIVAGLIAKYKASHNKNNYTSLP